VTIRITIRIREELAFGGGLCSLSTSSYIQYTEREKVAKHTTGRDKATYMKQVTQCSFDPVLQRRYDVNNGTTT